MKKFILTSLALGSCLMLASCGSSSDEAAIQGLNNQLDRLNNVVTNSAVISANDLSLSTYNNQNGDLSRLNGIYQKTSVAVSKQNDLREKILEKTAMVKKQLFQNEISLAENLNAIKELTNSISKYTTKLANTNNEYRKTSKSISRMKNNTNTLTVDLNSKYTKLSSCAETRSCYLTNLLNTLDEIENILGYTSAEQNQEPANQLYDSNDKWIKNGYCHNCNNEMTNDVAHDGNGIVANQNYNQFPERNFNIPNREFMPNNMPTNQYYNNYYQYPNSFNPNRNTDTFAPNYTNIDTYRNYGYGNGYGVMNRNWGYNGLKIDAKGESTEIQNDISQTNVVEDENKNEEDMSSQKQTIQYSNDEIIDKTVEKDLSQDVIDENEISDKTNYDEEIMTLPLLDEEKPVETSEFARERVHEDGNDDVNPKNDIRFLKKVNDKNENVKPI